MAESTAAPPPAASLEEDADDSTPTPASEVPPSAPEAAAAEPQMPADNGSVAPPEAPNRPKPTLVGQGTYGAVYREDHAVHGPLARKLFKAAVDRTFQEIMWALKLVHPHILGALEVAPSLQAPLHACLTMPFVANTPVVDLARVARGLLSALAHLHERGIVHLDIKPDNVLVAPGDHAYLIDFSLTALASSLGSAQRDIWPTVHFRAPELFERLPHLHASPAVDVWALGCTLYQMRTGRTYVRPLVKNAHDAEQALRLFWRMARPIAGASCLLPDAQCRVEDARERDLLARMLHLSPAARWPAARCLEHPYVRHAQHDVPDDAESSEAPRPTAPTPETPTPACEAELPLAFALRPPITPRERVLLCHWAYRMAANHSVTWGAFVHAVALFDRAVALADGAREAGQPRDAAPAAAPGPHHCDAACQVPCPAPSRSFQFEMVACAFASFFVHDNVAFDEETYFRHATHVYAQYRDTLWATYTRLGWEFRLRMPDLAFVDKRALAAVLVSGGVYENPEWLAEALQAPETVTRVCEARIRRHAPDYAFRHLA